MKSSLKIVKILEYVTELVKIKFSRVSPPPKKKDLFAKPFSFK